MRTLEFNVAGQKIKKVGDFSGLVHGTRGYLNARFSFDESWKGYKKAACFKYKNTCYYEPITETVNAYPSASTATINKRINSSGVLVDADGYVSTNYISTSDLFGQSMITIYGMTDADSAEHTAYIKGATFYNTTNCIVAYCNSDKGQLGRFSAPSDNASQYSGETGDVDWVTLIYTDAATNLANISYIRFCVKYSDAALTATPSDIVITIDEELS